MSVVTLTADLRNLVGERVDDAELWITAPDIKVAGEFRAGKLTKVRFDRRGRLSVKLLATNTPGTDPEEWQYGFEVRGTGLRKFYATLTQDADLTELQPMDPSAPDYLPVYVPAPGPKGDKGDRGDDGADGAQETAYAESTEAFETYAVYNVFEGAMPGLLVSVVGQGRPVEIEAFLPGVYSSNSSGTSVLPFIRMGNDPAVAIFASSPKTGEGAPVTLKRRLVLADGVTYTFAAGVMATSGGVASNIFAGSVQPAYLSVMTR